MHNLILIFEAQRNFAKNFLIQLKRNAIPQLRNGIVVPSQNTTWLPQLKLQDTKQIPHFCDFRQKKNK